jgi:excisionase family DNA binding protein
MTTTSVDGEPELRGPAPTILPSLLTADDVSKLLGGVPRKTILQYAREGRLPHRKIGRHVRFVPSELETWLLEKAA